MTKIGKRGYDTPCEHVPDRKESVLISRIPMHIILHKCPDLCIMFVKLILIMIFLIQVRIISKYRKKGFKSKLKYNCKLF